MQIKTVTIIGVGAVGAVIAEPISKFLGKENVQILAEGERLERYRSSGLYINGRFLDFNYTDPDDAKVSDLVIIATKYNNLAEAIAMAKNAVGENTCILSLLNGIQSEKEIAAAYGSEKVLYSFVLSLNTIHTGNQMDCTNNGKLFFGEDNNEKTERVKALSEMFISAGINAINPDDIHLEQWKKFLINCVFNTTSALTRSPYGGFRIPVMQELARKTGKEVIQVANASGVPLTENNLEDDIEMMCNHDIHGKTSMLQDMEAGRISENEYMCGTIVKLGAELGIDTPVCSTLCNLMRGTEAVRNI